MVQSIRTEPAIWFNAQQRDQARIRFNELKRQIDLRHEMPVVGEMMIRGKESNYGLGRVLRHSQQAEKYGRRGAFVFGLYEQTITETVVHPLLIEGLMIPSDDGESLGRIQEQGDALLGLFQ